MKRILAYILALITLTALLSGCSSSSQQLLQRDDWSDDVRSAVNDFIDMYGSSSENYSENSYVVTDFDNTASVFDMCEQFVIYQAQVMGYGFTPEELPDILSSGLGDMDEDLSRYGYGKGSYQDWAADITAAYAYLYSVYGPFTPQGVNEETAQTIQADPMWAEFTAKLMNMYELIGDNESTDVSYPWITYLFTGMTGDEVYALARVCYAEYGRVDTSEKTIRSPENIESRVGATAYTYIEGVAVTENTKELWQALDAAGFDVWVCSASECDLIRAAVDEFGLHDYCTAVIGMTPTVTGGKLSCTYDYETGYARYADADGGWSCGTVSSGAQTQGTGKVEAVQNICTAQYGCGPLAGFMDSTGDYNFCTEFGSLKLVVCFNRADRKVTDGGSVIAEVAVYQKDVLGYDLESANAAGDTLYVLQGRDENGTRSLRNSSMTIKYGESEEKLFRDEKNIAVYSYIVENRLTTRDAIDTFALKTSGNAAGNPLGFDYGFLGAYAGYHSK